MTARRRAGSLVLTRSDVAALMSPADWLDAAETAFRAVGEGRAGAPPPMEIAGEEGAFHAKGAWMRLERRYVALKLNGNFPFNPDRLGLPTIQGAILLCDGGTGAMLAIMDSMEVTLRRTAAATALAARHLARVDAASVLICGCGAQGRAQLAALRSVLPLRHCLAWDRDPARAARFAREEGAEAIEALADAPRTDVIVTCTTAGEPFLTPEHVAPGTFVAAVGADSPHKNEIAPALMAGAKVVADLVDQCLVMGDLRHAVAAGAMARRDVHAELAELVAGAKPGRGDPDEITLFDSTGTALQDVAAAATLYERARSGGRHRRVALAA